MVTFGAVREKTYDLIPIGDYCLTLLELEEREGQWGDRLAWKFLASPPDDYANYIARQDGMERTVWIFTDRDVVLGSFCQKLVETLSGRKFDKDDEPPSEDELLGKRCLGFIGHETPTKGKNAGKPREVIAESSIRPFRAPAMKVAPNVMPTAPTQVSADPSDDEIERATLVTKLQKQVAKLGKLDAGLGSDAEQAVAQSDLTTAPLDDIQSLLDSVTAAVNAALDD